VAVFGFRYQIDGISARRAIAGVLWPLFSLLLPDEEASFVNDVSLRADNRARHPRRRMSEEGAHASQVMSAGPKRRRGRTS
jgi:hypothetical protein